MTIIEASIGAVGIGTAALAIVSAITPDNTTAIAGAAVLVIGAVAAAAVAIIKALRETKETVEKKVATVAAAVETVADLNLSQDRKLAGIKQDTRTIVFVTDGNYTKLLEEIAAIRLSLAHETGTRADLDNAVHAQARADQHATLSADAKAASAAGVPTPTHPEEKP